MIIRPKTPELVGYVVDHLRSLDREELFANTFSETPEEIVQDTLRAGPLSWVFCNGETPVAVCGASLTGPALYQVFMYATDEFPTIWRGLTKFIIRGLMWELLDRGLMRGECRSICTHAPAHRWLGVLGARNEGRLRSHGKNGEDFYMFGWTRKDVIKRSGYHGFV